MKRVEVRSWYSKKHDVPKVIEGEQLGESEKAVRMCWGDDGEMDKWIPKSVIKECKDLPEPPQRPLEPLNEQIAPDTTYTIKAIKSDSPLSEEFVFEQMPCACCNMGFLREVCFVYEDNLYQCDYCKTVVVK